MVQHFGIHQWLNPELRSKLSCFLPCGKAELTASPLLPRVCGSTLQLHPWTPWSCGILDFCNVGVTSSSASNADRWNSAAIQCVPGKCSQVQGSPFRVAYLLLTLCVNSRANCHASISSNRLSSYFLNSEFTYQLFREVNLQPPNL